MRRPTLGDRPRQWLVALGVVVLFLSLFANFYQQRQNGQQAAQYHASNLHQQHEIERLLRTVIVVGQDNHATVTEVEALAKQVASVIDGLPAADKYLGALAAGLENQLQSLCNVTHASCSNLPVSLPGSSTRSTPTQPVPSAHAAPTMSAPATTTTVPPKHRGKNR